MALTTVELADQQQPAPHARGQMGRALTDLGFEALERSLDSLDDVLRHEAHSTKRVFDFGVIADVFFDARVPLLAVMDATAIAQRTPSNSSVTSWSRRSLA